jgi:hypothetical protein
LFHRRDKEDKIYKIAYYATLPYEKVFVALTHGHFRAKTYIALKSKKDYESYFRPKLKVYVKHERDGVTRGEYDAFVEDYDEKSMTVKIIVPLWAPPVPLPQDIFGKMKGLFTTGISRYQRLINATKRLAHRVFPSSNEINVGRPDPNAYKHSDEASNFAEGDEDREYKSKKHREEPHKVRDTTWPLKDPRGEGVMQFEETKDKSDTSQIE